MLTLKGDEHIGIVRLSALGDVIMLVPMVITLRKAYPRLTISWIIARPLDTLLEGLEGIHFIVIDKPKNLLDYFRLYKQFKNISFDIVLAVQANFRANVLTGMMNAKFKIGYDPLRAKDLQSWVINKCIPFANEHILDSYFAFLEQLGIKERKITWDLPIRDIDYAWAKAHLPKDKTRLLMINPAASKSQRNWLTERYIAVAKEAIVRWNVNIVLTGGANKIDLKIAKQIASSLPKDKVTNLVGATQLKQLAAVLSHATCLLAPDTGPVHLAVAMHVPVIGLYANFSAKKTGSYLFRDLTVDVYREAVIKFLKKDPNELPWNTRVYHKEAMQLISVESVLKKLEQLFEKSIY